jgi:hypothetical protein
MSTQPSKRPRKIEHPQQSPPRGTSTDTNNPGGVPLPQTSRASSTEPQAPATLSSTSRNRRRPRKLNRDPASSLATAAPGDDAQYPQLQQQKQQSDVSREISGLKSRVEDIERQVREMLAAKQGGATPNGKSSRRRLRRSKEKDNGETEAQELERLRGDLVAANRELAALKDEDRQQEESGVAVEQSQGEDEEEIEEIPREEPSLERNDRPAAGQRSVTFSGSYKFNLPAAVSDDELAAVKTGLHGIQSIARKFMEEAREGEPSTVGASGKMAVCSSRCEIYGRSLTMV